MKTRNKILTGLALSAVLGTVAFAQMGHNGDCQMNGQRGMNKHHNSMMQNKHMYNMHKGDFKQHRRYGHQMPMLRIFKDLNLSVEQRDSIRKIVQDSRRDSQKINDAFTNSNFDKAKYVEIIKNKRENRIKAKADMIDKAYAVLTPKQKEQFKVLLDLRAEKRDNMMKRAGQMRNMHMQNMKNMQKLDK